VKNAIHLNSIGKVISTRTEIKDDSWDQENVLVELDSQGFSSEALAGLSDFSHVEIVFFMDQVDPAKVEKSARHTRNNTGYWK
jgi:tRNA (Thr-GGU) A37 N-methylase